MHFIENFIHKNCNMKIVQIIKYKYTQFFGKRGNMRMNICMTEKSNTTILQNFKRIRICFISITPNGNAITQSTNKVGII